MGEVCIQYGGGVHKVWGKCVYCMGEVCILYGGGVQRFRSISKTGRSALFEFPRKCIIKLVYC